MVPASQPSITAALPGNDGQHSLQPIHNMKDYVVQGNGREQRLYGLDWLRIGAFGLLILYHIGMFFVPWEWHVKTARPLEWLELPMLAVNPWRLALLFVISGVASRILLEKMSGPGGFIRSRSARLLIPLAAGMILFVAPQPWAELRSVGLIQEDFWTFWARHNFAFGEVHHLDLPTWNHLWFVVYLWVYTAVLALLALMPTRTKEGLQRVFDRLFVRSGLLVWPMLLLFGARVTLFPIYGETHALVGDVYAHFIYGFAFFFGVGLAHSAACWRAIARQWRGALAVSLAAYGTIVLIDLTVPGESGDIETLVLRLARSIQAWGAIIGLLGFAREHLHLDSPARRYLTEAIFPYYIAHQTIIVLVAYWLMPLRVGAAVEFAIILPGTLVGCAITYEVGRRIRWLRPLVGLKPLPARRPSTVRTEPTPV